MFDSESLVAADYHRRFCSSPELSALIERRYTSYEAACF